MAARRIRPGRRSRRSASRRFAAPGDVAEAADCRAIVDGGVAELGGPRRAGELRRDRHGRTRRKPSPKRVWDATLDTNLKGTFFCTQAALPHLRASTRQCGEPRVGRGPHRRGGACRLLRLEGRRREPHPRAGPRTCARYARQLRLPRLCRHRHGAARRDRRLGGPGSHRSRPCTRQHPSTALPRRRKSPRRSSTSPRTQARFITGCRAADRRRHHGRPPAAR